MARVTVGDETLRQLRRLRGELAWVPLLQRERETLVRAAARAGHSQRRIAIAAGLSQSSVVRIIQEREGRPVQLP